MGTGSGGLPNEPVSRWFAAMMADAVDRLAECAAARVRRVLLQHQLWIDLEMVAAIGAEIFPHVRDL